MIIAIFYISKKWNFHILEVIDFKTTMVKVLSSTKFFYEGLWGDAWVGNFNIQYILLVDGKSRLQTVIKDSVVHV